MPVQRRSAYREPSWAVRLGIAGAFGGLVVTLVLCLLHSELRNWLAELDIEWLYWGPRRVDPAYAFVVVGTVIAGCAGAVLGRLLQPGRE